MAEEQQDTGKSQMKSNDIVKDLPHDSINTDKSLDSSLFAARKGKILSWRNVNMTLVSDMDRIAASSITYSIRYSLTHVYE